MTETKKNGLGPGSVEIDNVRFHTSTFDFDGTRYTVRELSPDEGDEANEAAKGPDGKVNTRLETKLLLSKAMVEPKIGADEIGKRGNQTYTLILREFNKLNSPPAEKDPTPPAG